LALVILWFLIGWSVVAGFSFMLLMIPISAFLFVRMSKVRELLYEKNDQRVKHVNELLQGIR